MNPYPPILDRLGRGQPVHVSAVAGGCISDARVAEFADGSKVFVKCLEGVAGLFECEAMGLRALANAKVIRVPGVIAVEEGALVLEYIDCAPKRRDFFESFGRSLALLHQVRAPCSGFSHDNFIGSTRQRNLPVSDQPTGDGTDWAEFYLERRLRFQLKLAAENGHGSDLESLFDDGEKRITALLIEAIELPSLLHGDLWGGNFMVDENGEACLIDPAVYYGHRETDLAMTELFGGFDTRFYDAYREAFPLAPRYEKRRPIYQLYHLLNHLNLFGKSYYSQCLRILQGYSTSPR